MHLRRSHLHRRPLSLLAFGSCLALGVLGPTESRAAPCNEPPHALVADLGLHVIGVGYQHTLGCHAVLQVSAGLYSPWTVNGNVLGLGVDHDPDGDVTGAIIRIRTFLFPLGRAPSGLWLSPFVQAGVVGGTRDQELTGAAMAAGLSVGWTWRLGADWLVGLGLGVQYHSAWFEGSAAYPGFARFAPTVDINVGYRF